MGESKRRDESMSGETFWCDDIEYEVIYLDGVIPYFAPVEDIDCLDYDEKAYLQGDYDEEVYEDTDVLQAIEGSMKHELKKIAENDPVSRGYLEQCEEEEDM
jgi:hypothetical protein